MSSVLFGHNSAPRARNQTKYKGNSSNKHPGASYTSQGPQNQPEILKPTLYSLYIPFNFIHIPFEGTIESLLRDFLVPLKRLIMLLCFRSGLSCPAGGPILVLPC